jgi:hypothetical protein
MKQSNSVNPKKYLIKLNALISYLNDELNGTKKNIPDIAMPLGLSYSETRGNPCTDERRITPFALK